MFAVGVRHKLYADYLKLCGSPSNDDRFLLHWTIDTVSTWCLANILISVQKCMAVLYYIQTNKDT